MDAQWKKYIISITMKEGDACSLVYATFTAIH